MLEKESLAKLGSLNHEDLCELARERFAFAAEAEGKWRAVAMEDLRFRAGEQWSSEVLAARSGGDGRPSRPCLTINRIQSNIRNITNQQRANKIGIKVVPVDDDADVDTADVIQGLIRHIESQSRADIAYETAFTSAVERGKGYFRICTEFVQAGQQNQKDFTAKSFEQEIRIKRIRNPFSVYFDPATHEPDFSDANYCFIISNMSKRAFQSAYPHADMAALDTWRAGGSTWVRGDEIQVAEYYFIERDSVELGLIGETGQVMPIKDMTAAQKKDVTLRRRSLTPTVYHTVINGHEVLDKSIVQCSFIPVVPMLGDEIDADGEVDYAGIVRYAKDPQRAYNYWVSSAAEMIAMAPKTPVVGVSGQFAGHEAKWNTVNNVPYGFMEYNAVDVEGRPAPSPHRLESISGTQIQAITFERQQAADDLKTTTGQFDASLGNRSNETSGIAIRNRAVQGEMSSFHFTDNKVIAVNHAGRILVEMIPRVYDSPRTARILGDDDSEKIVRLNEYYVDDKGRDRLYNLSAGRYDVKTTVGQAFGTRRQEALELQTSLIDKYPPLFEMGGDIILQNIDGPGASELAERFKKTIPPELLEVNDDEATNEQRMQQQVRELTGKLQAMSQAGELSLQAAQEQQTRSQEAAKAIIAEMQKTKAEMDQLKAQAASKEQEFSLKEADLQLREKELALEARFRQRELALKEEIERGKLDLAQEKQDMAVVEKL